MTLKIRISILIAALGLSLAPTTFASTLVAANSLIKGPGDTVYYYGSNGKRYVFPTAKTYFTWYSDFSGVINVSAGDLAEIPLAGNVTYRPGVKLVKITTDPKVYAVSSRGTLRWIETESAAKALYGADWNTKIDDVPDAFFINYSVGASIKNASDFQPDAQTLAAKDISTDKGITGELPPTTPPPPTTTSTPPTNQPPLAFSVFKTTVQAGDTETLTAYWNEPSSISKIELFFDGVLVKTCTAISCSADTQVPTSGTKTSYVAEGRVTRLDTSVVSQTVTVSVMTDGSSLVHLSVGQAVITPSQAGSAIVDIDASIAILRVDIYLDGTAVKGCADGARECRWSDYVPGSIGSVHPVYAKVTDTLGRTYTSRTLSITLNTNDSPGVTVSPAKTMIYSGEMVDVTVSASDNDGIASIDVMKDGAVLKHCDGASPCTASTGPWPTAGTTLSFTGRATDAKGMVGTASESQTVSVAAH